MAKTKFDYIRTEEDEISFTTLNPETVERLKRDGEVKVPEKKLKVPKDEQWNMKQLGSKLLQGIENGDSIAKIAKSFGEVIKNNEVSAIRNARTMTTSAECHGRMDSYTALAEQGVIQKKVWIATPDDRTRASHLQLDGEEQDIDEPFSNGLMFPSDSEGDIDPSEVWNCRCSMSTRIVGFKKADGRISYVQDVDEPKSLHDEQIKREREERKEATQKIQKEDNMPNKEDNMPNIVSLGKAPQRPLKPNFDNEDEYYEARANYRKQREEWETKVDEFVLKSIPEKSMSKDEFSSWCKKKDIKIATDISKVDGRALTAYTTRMEKLANDFPEVMKYRENLPIPKEFQMYEFGFEDTNDYIAEAGHGFYFGASGSNIESLLRDQIYAVSNDIRVSGEGYTLNALFDHEFGHNVEAAIESKFERDSEGMLTQKGHEQMKKMRNDLIENVYGKNGMSEYATTNEYELFAEAFASWYGKEDSGFARAFGEFMERWYYK